MLSYSKKKMLLRIVTPLLFVISAQVMAEELSPCADALIYLNAQYQSDPATQKAFDAAYTGLTDLPAGYSYGGSSTNPWKAAGSGAGLQTMMNDMFETWCTALPEIQGDNDNALDPILYFAWFYYQNQAGQDFVQGRDPSTVGAALATGPTFLSKWTVDYLGYMNSSASTGQIAEWVADPRIEITDYTITDPTKFNNWNDFFARNLISDSQGNYPSRPVTLADKDYVIVSPTDCIMNPLVQVVQQDATYSRTYIDNPLQLDTVLDVKNIPISVNDMLGSVSDDIKAKFVRGSGLTCVLMPNTYHHFHAPVDGTVLHAEVVKNGSTGTPSTFGYPDFPNWVPADGNVGRPGTDFSQFQAFQRGVIIIEVTYAGVPEELIIGGQKKTVIPPVTGYVASIPVGLDSVGSVVLNICGNPDTDNVNCFSVNGPVTKGKTKFGNFFFGGSLNILLFSEGMISPAVQTRMGNQIGVINIGTSPKSPWSMD